MHHDTNTFTDKITWKVCKKPEHPWVEMVESSVCVSSVWVEGPVHALGKILYLLSCFFAFWFSVWVERSVHALSKSTLSVIMVFAFEFYFGFSVCLEWPGALGKDIITANIFCRVFGHTTQIFQKHHFSKYFCRVFVTQLKYIKNIISANISAGDWSHSSPCFAFFAWSPFADPAVPPGWWSWWSRWKCDTDGPPHWRNGERQCGRANQAPASSPCPAPASRCDQSYQAFQQPSKVRYVEPKNQGSNDQFWILTKMVENVARRMSSGNCLMQVRKQQAPWLEASGVQTWPLVQVFWLMRVDGRVMRWESLKMPWLKLFMISKIDICQASLYSSF